MNFEEDPVQLIIASYFCICWRKRVLQWKSAFFRAGSANYGHWPDLACHLCLQIKFYWHKATLTSGGWTAELRCCDKNNMVCQNKLFPIWPFTEHLPTPGLQHTLRVLES